MPSNCQCPCHYVDGACFCECEGKTTGKHIDALKRHVELGFFDFFGVRDYESIREALDNAYQADCADAE
jgi:hypothetical protein